MNRMDPNSNGMVTHQVSCQAGVVQPTALPCSALSGWSRWLFHSQRATPEFFLHVDRPPSIERKKGRRRIAAYKICVSLVYLANSSHRSIFIYSCHCKYARYNVCKHSLNHCCTSQYTGPPDHTLVHAETTCPPHLHLN